ncbi:MAG: hypothetical protein H0V82_06795 [Candidatus Protochlamydia sp.]|nr:hypothetical protein [Candidatus Protochlamydia sp.]
MKSLQELVGQMTDLLEELVKTAQELSDISRQVISEDELAPLQQHQQDVLSQIEAADSSIKTHYPNQLDKEIKKHIHTKLHDFQLLNQEFISNLSASHGLIQFELQPVQEKEEDASNHSISRRLKFLKEEHE